MANEVLVKSGTPIVVTFTSLASCVTTTTNGAAQSAKMDLGATRAQQMVVRLQTQFTAAPTAGGTLEVYVGFSSQSTATSGNVAGLTGSDALYTGQSNNAGDAKRQLTFVGVMVVAAVSSTTTSASVVQVADVGSFVPTDRYCQVVVVDNTSQNMATYSAWHVCTIYPVVDEVQ
jgi:hypothetical protein